MSKTFKPGTPKPESGQYVEVGPRGGRHGGSEITAVFGKPLPPTSSPDCTWQLVDRTRHKR